MKELTVIMPVYNEDEVIMEVLNEWLEALRKLDIDFDLCVYNDGSKDNTLGEINKVAIKNNEIKVFDKKNSGHGPTIIEGYRQSKGEWIFQTDSDNEISPDQFVKIWEKRSEMDFIIGTRIDRKSPMSRKIISLFSKYTIRFLYGKGVSDVNCPFRLYNNEKFAESFKKIPSDTFAPNVILSGIACHHRTKIFEVPVVFKPRSTGEVSIQKWKLLKVAFKSYWQTISFRIKIIFNNT